MLARWLLVAWLAAPPPAAPPSVEAAEVGRARAEAGRAAFAAERYAEAARLFEAADAIDPRPAYRLSVAIARAEAGALVEAAETLRTLPDYPPAVEALVRVEARVLTEMPPVTVVGAPDGARITLGDRPLPGHVPVGDHPLRIEHPDIFSYEAVVTVHGGAPVELRPALARRADHGALHIRLAEGWAVELDARAFEGPTDARHVVPEGPLRLTVRGPSGRADAHTLAVIPGDTTDIEAPADVTSPTAAAGRTVMLGSGAAGALGLGLLLWAVRLDADAADAVLCARAGECRRDEVEALEDEAFGFQAAGFTLLGLGAAGLVAGGLIVGLDETLPVWIGPAGIGAEAHF